MASIIEDPTAVANLAKINWGTPWETALNARPAATIRTHPQIDAISANGVRDPTEGQKGAVLPKKKARVTHTMVLASVWRPSIMPGSPMATNAPIHDGQETPRTDYEHQHPLVFESNGPPLGRAGGIRLEAQMCPVAFCIVIVAAFPLQSGRPSTVRGGLFTAISEIVNNVGLVQASRSTSP